MSPPGPESNQVAAVQEPIEQWLVGNKPAREEGFRRPRAEARRCRTRGPSGLPASLWSGASAPVRVRLRVLLACRLHFTRGVREWSLPE